MEKCDNCGKAIGKLETPQLWKESVVCTACRKLLEEQESEKRTQFNRIIGGEKLAAIKKRNRTISIIFFIVLIAGVVYIATHHIADDDLPVYAVSAVIPIVLYMAWLPIAIAQGKGRKDKTTAVGALSIFGILTLGILWIAALIWAIGLETKIDA